MVVVLGLSIRKSNFQEDRQAVFIERRLTMRNSVRLFVALWYLLGWLSHVYLGLFAPETYRPFGETALIPAYTDFWQSMVMPFITAFALGLAVFEVLVGCLLISKGNWVKTGLVFSILFNLFLVQMGLGYPATDPWSNFLVNRLPNLLFIALQVPLLWGRDEYSIPEVIRRRFFKTHTVNR